MLWSDDGGIRVWSLAQSDWSLFLQLHDTVLRAVLDRAETRILTDSDDNIARLWDATTGQVLSTMPHNDRIRGILWDQDETRVYTWSDSRLVYYWDVSQSGEAVLITSMEHPFPV